MPITVARTAAILARELPGYLLVHTAAKGQYLMVLKDAFSEPDQQRVLRICQEKIAARRLSFPPPAK